MGHLKVGSILVGMQSQFSPRRIIGFNSMSNSCASTDSTCDCIPKTIQNRFLVTGYMLHFPTGSDGRGLWERRFCEQLPISWLPSGRAGGFQVERSNSSSDSKDQQIDIHHSFVSCFKQLSSCFSQKMPSYPLDLREMASLQRR